MEITHDNFFVNTFACFKGCKKPKKNPDFISNSGSEYWYGEDRNGRFVIRHSDHWSEIYHRGWIESFDNGSIRTCYWILKTNIVEEEIKMEYTGKCYLLKFQKNKQPRRKKNWRSRRELWWR